MPGLDRSFGHHGEVKRLDGRRISRDDLVGADILLVRSITRVGADLLQGTGVRFVGSATFGQQTVGIIGRGNVGRRLEHLLKVLNIPVMSCDPPLQDEGEQQLVCMDEVCGNSIISLHVPLTKSGKYPTNKLFNSRQLERLNPDTLLVNTSRGAVIEKTALLEQLSSGRLQAALDVWPDEPFIEAELLDLVTVATPHVAGYSNEGKQAGTDMIYSAFCKAFNLKHVSDTKSGIKTPPLLFPPETPTEEVLEQSVQSSSQVNRDDAALRELAPSNATDKRVQIDSLRAAYPERFEFKSHLVRGIADPGANLLRQLGFKTA